MSAASQGLDGDWSYRKPNREQNRSGRRMLTDREVIAILRKHVESTLRPDGALYAASMIVVTHSQLAPEELSNVASVTSCATGSRLARHCASVRGARATCFASRVIVL